MTAVLRPQAAAAGLLGVILLLPALHGGATLLRHRVVAVAGAAWRRCDAIMAARGEAWGLAQQMLLAAVTAVLKPKPPLVRSQLSRVTWPLVSDALEVLFKRQS
jgi:hypothetical protein